MSKCLLVTAAVLAAAGVTSAVAQDARRPTRILLVYQQQAETPPMVEFTQRLRATIAGGLGSPVEFYQESLDLDRFTAKERGPPLTSYFEHKYRGFGIDLVVPVGGQGLQFAVDQLSGVLPGIPIVFALTAAPVTNPSTVPGNVTGRIGLASRFAPTLTMARALQPDAERVVVIGGASAADSAAAATAVEAVSERPDALPVSLLVGLSLDTLLNRLHHLPHRSIVILASFRRDGAGQAFDLLDLVGTMSRASAAPMYTQLRSYVGEGLVGGSVTSFDDEGHRTGQLVVRVLRRRVGQPMPPIELIANSFVVDWRELRRWDLSERRLPPGTEVLFREPTVWARYRGVVLLTLGVIAVEASLIALLLFERRRRIRAQLAVEEQAEYERTMARLTTDVVRHAPDEVPQALEDALAHIGQYAGASSATLVQSSDPAIEPPVSLNWTAPTNGNGEGHHSANVSTNYAPKESRLEIPLVADGTSIGMLKLTRGDGQGWPAMLIRRLDSAAEVIAGAMARSRAIRTIHRGEELNRAVLASMSTQIAILDNNGTIIRVNAAWRRVAARAEGDAVRDAFVGVNYLEECRRAELRGSDEARDVRNGIEAVLERRAWPFRFEYHCADSVERWYELFVDRLQISEGGAIVTYFDITDRRLAERGAEETRRQVAHMGRMAFVGELAATISHELRQPLAAIRVNAEAGAQLLARNPADPEAREIFQSIVADNVRAVELIEGVRKLLRKEESVMTTVDLNQVCRDAVRLLQHDAALRGTRLELSLAPESPMVPGDPVQLQQVVLNLALNGLESASTSATDRSVLVRTESGTDHAELLVYDSGPGIPTNVQPHLFEAFFSTKTEGLGMGLVIVRSIVERHNGRIRAENHSAGGAVFCVRLPTVPRPAGVTAPAGLSDSSSARTLGQAH